jgi:hypothetical protein
VIFESWPWRQDLLRDASILRRWTDKPPTERRAFLFEKKIFTSAYAMRKLVESLKLSSDYGSYSVKCKTYPSLRPITWRDRWEFYEHYDMERPVEGSIAASALLNLIIHSFLFLEFVDEDTESILGFHITSDRRRNESLWQIGMNEYLSLMEHVAADNPSNFAMRFDKAKGEWAFWRGHGEPPPEFRS